MSVSFFVALRLLFHFSSFTSLFFFFFFFFFPGQFSSIHRIKENGAEEPEALARSR
jgi:hypothetical protein